MSTAFGDSRAYAASESQPDNISADPPNRLRQKILCLPGTSIKPLHCGQLVVDIALA
jgi:hypothetical protein